MNELTVVDDTPEDEGTDPVVDRYQFPRGRPPPGAWVEHGLCQGHPNPSLWFPERGESVAEAKAICRVCPVKGDCLEHALRHRERHGIWGGRSERERRRLRPSTKTTRRGAA